MGLAATEHTFSEPMSADDGLPYVILEMKDDVDEARISNKSLHLQAFSILSSWLIVLHGLGNVSM